MPSHPSRPRRGHGFTLIELLVVVTIIAILLALLMPALDKAIYQAELAVCGTRLAGIAGVTARYAMDQRRRYPYREGIHKVGGKPSKLTWGSGTGPVVKYPEDAAIQWLYDDRAVLRPYLQLNKHLLEPMGATIDLEKSLPTTHAFSGYNLYFGFQFRDVGNNATGQKGLYRLGDKLQWEDRDYNVIAVDVVGVGDNNDRSFSGHPDDDRILNLWTSQDQTRGVNALTRSLYEAPIGVRNCGSLDLNFAWTDGSVHRFSGIPWPQGDDRFNRVPETSRSDTVETLQVYSVLPR